MSWRKHETHNQETAAVRKALRAAGINAKVGHGRGTAWGWLEINIGAGQQWGEHEKSESWEFCSIDCRRCSNLKAMAAKAQRIIKEVTGRHGAYGGDVLILTQDGWSNKAGHSVPIEHPNWNHENAHAKVGV